MKNLYLITAILFQTFYTIGQCPIAIDDDGGDGSIYYMTLTDGVAECPNYGSDITINGQTYEFSDCYNLADDGADEVEFIIAAGGTPVIISTDAPFDIVNGATTCMYQSSGLLLPVEFLYFRTEKRSNQILLKWATATEFKNAGFEIQHSINGEEWKKIGYTSGQGDSYEKSTYEYTHTRPILGNNYYRLKQIDFDGQFDYSNIETVQFYNSENTPIQIFPNPIKDVALTVKLETYDDNEIQIHLYDLTGRTWLQQTSFDATTNLNVNDLAAGIYLIEIAANGQTTRQKVVIE